MNTDQEAILRLKNDAHLQEDRSAWRPTLLNLADADDREELDRLARCGLVHRVYDCLSRQIADLAKTRAAGNMPDDVALAAFQRELTDGMPLERWGRWAFYPWNGNLVHLLPSDLFRELRLNRNRNKLTLAEQDRLARLTVGVAGLSVGNVMALTMAMEGCFGTLKLADFDTLDLSNMNRIRASVWDLGVQKTVLAARQITEINPYAHLVLFQDGLTEDNLDDFLGGETPLDVLVEECDSMHLKIVIRERARQHRIPVVMESSDGSVMDVERFDLEPDRPILHGRIGEVNVEGMSPEALQFDMALRINPISGLTTRMAASLLERGETLSTWPQLASDVVVGGGHVCMAVREIGLGREMKSGRRILDPLALMTDGPREEPKPRASESRLPKPADRDDWRQLRPKMRSVVEAAVMAPSGGNAQPWRFYADGDVLWLAFDRDRSTNLMDRGGRASMLSLGAVAENAELQAKSLGWDTEVKTFPAPDQRHLVASLSFREGSPALDPLQPYIATRHTNRRMLPPAPIPAEKTAALGRAAQERHAEMVWEQDRERLDRWARLLGEVDRLRLLHPRLHRDLVGELRYTPESAAHSRDGIDLQSCGLDANALAGVFLISRPDVSAFLRAENGSRGLTKYGELPVRAAGALGLMVTAGTRPEDWFQAGRAMQRIWLAATAQGLGFQPVGSILFLLEWFEKAEEGFFNHWEAEVAKSIVEEFRNLTADIDGVPAFLFRVFESPQPVEPAHRLPLSKLVRVGSPIGRPLD
ncbi:Rv1355c family protein [Sulfidibacter corallicola]|uniref:Rv1355c family protein n=1 Tax=Sulfidibacter corallicola TaxID=2818388 RepID=A0A8A4TNP7_SULCO|nr:Rv1355c family protein [Sulfidibacter corallicola]QTD51596.1 Rv1355c family protein [Sulfidibacter corallicola]